MNSRVASQMCVTKAKASSRQKWAQPGTSKVYLKCLYAHILYFFFNQWLHHKFFFPEYCDLLWSEIWKDDLMGSRDVLHHTALPQCSCFCQTLSLFPIRFLRWIPPTLPFKHTLALKCKTLSASGRSADYMLSEGNLLTDKPEHFNHLLEDGDNTSHLTLRPLLFLLQWDANWSRANLSRLFLRQMTPFIWARCCLIFQTFHLGSGCLFLGLHIGFHFDHHIENMVVESEMNLVWNEEAAVSCCILDFWEVVWDPAVTVHRKKTH